MTVWMDALKEWNSKKGGKWCIPKKGSKEYDAVKKLMDKKGKGLTISKPKETRVQSIRIPSSKKRTSSVSIAKTAEAFALPPRGRGRKRKNQVAKPIVMTKADFMAEHKKLIDLLETISQRAGAEASEQKDEVAKYQGGCEYCCGGSNPYNLKNAVLDMIDYYDQSYPIENMMVPISEEESVNIENLVIDKIYNRYGTEAAREVMNAFDQPPKARTIPQLIRKVRDMPRFSLTGGMRRARPNDFTPPREPPAQRARREPPPPPQRAREPTQDEIEDVARLIRNRLRAHLEDIREEYDEEYIDGIVEELRTKGFPNDIIYYNVLPDLLSSRYLKLYYRNNDIPNRRRTPERPRAPPGSPVRVERAPAQFQPLMFEEE